eukprot:scaffold150263_cov76-Attheya_sp.AAC.2
MEIEEVWGKDVMGLSRPKLDLALSPTCCDTLLRQYDINNDSFCPTVNPNDRAKPSHSSYLSTEY